MRLLQLHLGDGQLIDLHPYVSVVTGLDDRQRHTLIDSVASLPSGRARSGGLVEAHGVLLDLDDSTLRLLDLGSVDAAPLVTAADLPSPGLHPAERERRAIQRGLRELGGRLREARERARRAAEAADRCEAAVSDARDARARAEAEEERRRDEVGDLTRRLDELAARRRAAQEEVDAARPRAEEARAGRAETHRAAEGPREAATSATARCSDLRARLARATERRDPGAGRELEEALVELERLEAERAAELAHRAARGEIPPEVRLEQAEARQAELRDLAAALDPVDVSAVADAHHRLVHIDEAPKVPSAEAMALAERLEEVVSRVRELDAPGDTADPVEARRRLDAAREAVLDAELAVRGPAPDADAVQAVEAAHAELLDAVDAVEGRLAGPRAQKRLERAREAERRALERLEFESYTDYRMGAARRPATGEQLEELEAALAVLADAERAVELARSRAEAELERATALDAQRCLLVDARGHLGEPVTAAQAIDALRELRVPVTPPDVIAAELQAALAGAGMGIEGEQLELDDLLALAEACMAEVEQAAERRRSALDELDQLDGELSRLRAEVAAAEAAAVARREAGEIDPLDRARQRAETARARVNRDAEAAAEAASLDVELREAEAAEEAATASLEAAEALVVERTAAWERAEAELSAAEAQLAEVLEAQRTAAADLRQLEQADSASELSRLADELDRREAEVATARDELARAEAVRHDVERERAALEGELAELRAAQPDAGGRETIIDPLRAPANDDDPGTEDIEWYLLARLAAQRAASYAGSLPVLLDDALRELHPIEVAKILGRLERMAETVQVIVVSDADPVREWADAAGPERAAIVRAAVPA